MQPKLLRCVCVCVCVRARAPVPAVVGVLPNLFTMQLIGPFSVQYCL
jgi:hypothetical protein